MAATVMNSIQRLNRSNDGSETAGTGETAIAIVIRGIISVRDKLPPS
jgi:hypothetical protein